LLSRKPVQRRDRCAKLPITANTIGRLALEAEFRDMKSVELITRVIESVATEDQFDLVLEPPAKV
jgi:hypothetical protein